MRIGFGFFFVAMFCNVALAADSTYVKLDQVTRDDVVVTQITRIRGSLYVIDLGYAHGVRIGSRSLAARTRRGLLEPVAQFTVVETGDEFSLARRTSGEAPEVGDSVFFAASSLDLWGESTRLEHARHVRDRRIYRKGGYDTRELRPSLLVKIVGDDDRSLYDLLRAETASVVSQSGFEMTDALSNVERFANAIGRDRFNQGRSQRPEFQSEATENADRLERGADRTAAALGLHDLQSLRLDPTTNMMDRMSHDVRDRMVRSAIRETGPKLREDELEGIQKILTDIVQQSLRGGVPYGTSYDLAVEQIRKQMSELEDYRFWATFISKVMETVEANQQAANSRLLWGG